MSGKGSAPRPFSVKDDVFTENYCMTFGCKPKDGHCKNCGAKLSAASEQELTGGQEAGDV